MSRSSARRQSAATGCWQDFAASSRTTGYTDTHGCGDAPAAAAPHNHNAATRTSARHGRHLLARALVPSRRSIITWLFLHSLCLLACGSACAQSVEFGAATRLPPLQQPAGGPEARYAIATRRDRIGRIVAPVMVNGQGPFRFMLDTGATRTALALSLVRRLNLPLDEQARVSITGVAGSAVVGTATVAQLRSGALALRGVHLPVLSGVVLDGIDGILGMDGMDRKRVTADFVRDRLLIEDSPNRRSAFGRSVIPLQFLSDRLLLVDGRVGQVGTRIIIDTGGTHTLGNRALYDALARGNAIQGWEFETSVTDVVSATQLGTIRRAPLLRLGASTIDNVSVTFGDFHVFDAWHLGDQPALLLGMDVLGTLAEFTVDYRRRLLEIAGR